MVIFVRILSSVLFPHPDGPNIQVILSSLKLIDISSSTGILLKDFSNPMWFMAMFVFSYSLVGLVLIGKQKLIDQNTAKLRE